jgi:hypothetical protein
MSFFVTRRAGKGDGAILVDWPERMRIARRSPPRPARAIATWHAYLSANPQGQPAVNARDRIGNGP